MQHSVPANQNFQGALFGGEESAGLGEFVPVVLQGVGVMVVICLLWCGWRLARKTLQGVAKGKDSAVPLPAWPRPVGGWDDGPGPDIDKLRLYERPASEGGNYWERDSSMAKRYRRVD